jgi:hypothetical protein
MCGVCGNCGGECGIIPHSPPQFFYLGNLFT